MKVVMHVLITLVVAVAGVLSFRRDMGPYDIKLREARTCDDEGKGLIKFSSKIRSMGNGVYMFYGPFSFMVPMDEDVDIVTVIYTWGNGGFKMLMNETFRGCNAMWSASPEVYNDVSKHLGLPEKCPIPKGNYTLQNWKIKTPLATLPVLHYKKYKFVSTMYYKKVKVGCHIFIADVVPKNNSG